MSVILDALHKARGDKRNPQANNVARVLDAGVTSDAMLDVHSGRGKTSPAGRSGWIIGLAVVLGVVCLCLFAAGAFYLLYSQGKRLEESRIIENGIHAKDGAAATNQPPLMTPTDATASIEATRILETGLPLPALPTPLPLSELPVQPPVTAAGSAGANPFISEGSSSATAPAPTFKLGSIVCENEDCLASLNGRTVREGDEIRQYRVLRITAKEVTLKSITGNDVVTLSLFD